MRTTPIKLPGDSAQAQKLGLAGDGLQPAYIISGLSINAWIIMEAEQLNIVANRLVDLAQRATELRRYL
jgi:hypothetical protein